MRVNVRTGARTCTRTCAKVVECSCVSFDSEAIASIMSPLEEEILS